MSYIELENITFRYGQDGPDVLRDLSASFEKGSCTLVTGDNGSGKTTLFRVLAGLSFPQSGRYFFDGTRIDAAFLKNNANAKRFHKSLGFLFQNPDTMLFNPTVRDEIAFGPRQMGLSDGEVDERVRGCLDIFGIEGLAGKVPYHLSGGQKKLVAFASVMALSPDAVILDEPSAGLDRAARDRLAAFLAELKAAGKTLIIATHDEAFAGDLADGVLALSE